MAVIKNAILQPIQRLIGIAPASQPTVVDTDAVSLTMPIIPDMGRRSLASQPSGGMFQGVLENVHSAGDAEVSTISPYEAGGFAIPPYPSSIDARFDLWLLGVHGIRSSGVGTLTGATLAILMPEHVQAFGRDDSGATLVASVPMRVAEFDGISTIAGITKDPMITEQGLTYVKVGIRLIRGCSLDFHSVSGAAAEFQMVMLLGLFPAALGQDVIT